MIEARALAEASAVEGGHEAAAGDACLLPYLPTYLLPHTYTNGDACLLTYRPRPLKSTQGLRQSTWTAEATPEKSKEHPNLRILPFPKKWQDGEWILRYAGGNTARKRTKK